MKKPKSKAKKPQKKPLKRPAPKKTKRATKVKKIKTLRGSATGARKIGQARKRPSHKKILRLKVPKHLRMMIPRHMGGAEGILPALKRHYLEAKKRVGKFYDDHQATIDMASKIALGALGTGALGYGAYKLMNDLPMYDQSPKLTYVASDAQDATMSPAQYAQQVLANDWIGNQSATAPPVQTPASTAQRQAQHPVVETVSVPRINAASRVPLSTDTHVVDLGPYTKTNMWDPMPPVRAQYPPPTEIRILVADPHVRRILSEVRNMIRNIERESSNPAASEADWRRLSRLIDLQLQRLRDLGNLTAMDGATRDYLMDTLQDYKNAVTQPRYIPVRAGSTAVSPYE